MTYNSDWTPHWRDFHPLEGRLASVHWRVQKGDRDCNIEPPASPCTIMRRDHPYGGETSGPGARTFAELDALRRCSALNFSTRHCSLGPIPHIITTGKQRLARELPNKRRRTEFSVPYSGSAGAVGRHNKLQIEPCSARCHQAPTSVRAPQAAREARHSPNSTLGHSAKSRNGSARAQLGSVTQQRR